MKTSVPVFGFLLLAGVLVSEVAFAGGGGTRTAPRVVTPPPVITAPAPAPQTLPVTSSTSRVNQSSGNLSTFDRIVRQRLEERGLRLPEGWITWTEDQQDAFLADLDFQNTAAPVASPQVNSQSAVQRSSVVRPSFNSVPVAQNDLDEQVLSTLAAQNLDVPSAFSRWNAAFKRSFLKTLNRSRQSQVIKAPTAVGFVGSPESREVLTVSQQAEFDEQKAASQAAQAERIAVVEEATLVSLASGSLTGGAGKIATGNVAVEAIGEKVMITLGDGFSVSSGPDLFVTLTKEATAGKRSLDASQLITLDALASTNGKQVYTVSKEDFERYGDSLAIWCKQYNILFGSTVLQ